MGAALRWLGLTLHGHPNVTISDRLGRDGPLAAFAAILAAILSVATGATPARSQLLDQLINPDIPGIAGEPGVTVTSRQRPDYDPLGVRFGNVTVRPELRESVGYDDNVNGSSRAQGSALVETDARVAAKYEDSQSTAGARLSVDDVRYLSKSAQSFTNWQAGLGGTYLVGRDTLSLGYDHFNLSQTPRDLDVPQLDQPLAYRLDLLRASYKAVFSRLFVQPGIALAAYSYDNGTVGGKPYLQSSRNRLVATPSVTVGYELSPRRNLVFVVRDAVASYDNRRIFGAKPDFNDLSVLAGIDYDADGIWRFRLLGGYETRDFSSRQYKTIAAPIAEAAVIWSPTGLTTVTASATRHIQDSADDTTIGFTETALGLRVDHELLRNVLLQAHVRYAVDEYSHNQGTESLVRFGAGATWLLNRNLQLETSAEHSTRTSGGAVRASGLNGYDGTIVLVTLRLAL